MPAETCVTPTWVHVDVLIFLGKSDAGGGVCEKDFTSFRQTNRKQFLI